MELGRTLSENNKIDIESWITSDVWSLYTIMSGLCDSCFDFFFQVSTTTYDSIPPVSKFSVAVGDEVGEHCYSEYGKAKSGWIAYVTKAALLVDVHKRVFIVLIDGILYIYDHQITEDMEINENGAILVMNLSGAEVKSATSNGKHYGLIIKGQHFDAELDADSLSYQALWLKNIKIEIENANIIALSTEGEPNKGASLWYDNKKNLKIKSIILLKQGTPMTKHYLQMGRRKEHERVVSYDEKCNMVFWKSSKESEGGSDKEVILDKVLEIREGLTTKVLESLSADLSRSACCWSILTRDKTYDFEAQTVSEKERWVDNLRIILEVNR